MRSDDDHRVVQGGGYLDEGLLCASHGVSSVSRADGIACMAMLFRQAIPPGLEITPEERYTGLNLSRLAGEDRPYVVCNFVSSLDGKATAEGRTSALASEGDR